MSDAQMSPGGVARRVRALLVATAVTLPAVAGCGSGESETVPVALGTVTSAVTSSGTLRFIDHISVGFPEGGKLVALKVKLGDKVVPGQELAQVDNLEQRVAQRKALASVRIEEARLAKLVGNNSIETNDDEHDYAGLNVDDTTKIQEETIESDKASIGQLRRKLDFDRQQLARQQARLTSDQACLNDIDILTGKPAEECLDRINRDEDDVEDAKRDIIDRKAEINAAQNKLDVDRASRTSAINTAKRSRESAKNAEDKAKEEQPYDIEVQRQVLEQARADFEVTQRNLDKTIKPSAYHGTVDGINGQVGQVLTASYTRPLGGSVPTGGVPGDKLISLKDVNTYQVVVPFSESEGAKIKPEQAVEVSYGDLPGVSSPARIAAIDPPVPGVNASYLVTVVLTEVAPEVKDGLTARVAVAVNQIDNALTLPASAVRVNGRTGTVALRQPDGGTRETSVELGMIGDKTVQIMSGLKVDDLVQREHTG